MCLEGPNHPPIDYVIDDYQHGLIDRRQFLTRATALLGVSAASVLVASCAPQQVTAPAPTTAPTQAPARPTDAPKPAATNTAAPAPTTAPTTAPTAAATAAPAAKAAPTVPPYGTVPADAAGIATETVTFKADGADIKGYLARPATGGPYPAILVIHENRGLTPHEQDMARRYARAGFVALAIDMLSRQGGSEKFGTQQDKTTAIGQTKPEENVADMKGAVAFLKAHPAVAGGKIGVTGYCWGGQRTNMAAAAIPEVVAAVPYYGSPPPNVDDIKNTNAALLLVYAGNDERINASRPGYEAKLKEYNKTYQVKVYEGAGHAFNNDTGPNFKADAAKDAWEQAVTWFNKYLRT